MWNFFKNLFLVKKEEAIIEDSMKYLIVGLGNIGSKYDQTRHNIGFDVVDELAKSKDATWKQDTQAFSATIKHKGRTLLLIKPTTYMNLSGKAVRYWMTKNKIPAERILVIVDDLNLDFGKIRIRAKGKPGGHNGLKSINELLGSEAYPRLRMGIGDKFGKGRQVDYVLGKWDKKELEELPFFVGRAVDATLDFVSIGVARTMSQHNG